MTRAPQRAAVFFGASLFMGMGAMLSATIYVRIFEKIAGTNLDGSPIKK